ncbi:MAG: DNA-3-methyladenine glycosylase I, partial [Alphaproteobacteria bacterium]
MSWYCDIAPGHPFHGPYHDLEYGFPLRDETALFERLALEINQAGLSWLLVLKRREGLRRAFDGFAVDQVADYGAAQRHRLLADPAIIRNRLKVDAIIENARRVRVIREASGSFAAWIATHHPLPKDDWVRLFKKTFLFTGGEVTGEFLMSIGYLPGAHRPTCPVYFRIGAMAPPWMDSRVIEPRPAAEPRPRPSKAPAKSKKKKESLQKKRMPRGR